MNKKPRGAKWDKAQSIAAHVMMGLNEKKTAGATHYHATYVNPVWNSGLIKTKKIGTHIFYRFQRGNEWSVATARQAARLAQRRAGISTIVPADAAVKPETEVLTPVDAPEIVEEVTVADLNTQALESVQSMDLGEGAAIGG